MQLKRIFTFSKYHLKPFVSSETWNRLANTQHRRVEAEFREKLELNPHAKETLGVYVIRRRPPGGGLFSNVNHVLQGIEHSIERDLIPVVDMQNYWTSYSQRKKYNESYNAWEYFFEPVSPIYLNDLKNFSHVYFSRGDRITSSSILADKSLEFVMDCNAINYYGEIFHQYIKLNPHTQKVIERIKDSINWTENTIGVSYRGTDYLALKPKGHARQPELSEIKAEVMQKIIENPSWKLFISTEDSLARGSLSNMVSEKTFQDFRDERTFSRYISTKSRPTPQVLRALGYLAEMILLSEAKTIVCSIANGSATAILMNRNQYQSPVVINRGIY